MSTSNANNNPPNGPTVVLPKSSAGIVDHLRQVVTESAHFVLRLYFSILLMIYFWCVKIFTRALQPLEPFIQNMHKIPASEATTEGIKNQVSRLISTILLLLAPLVNKVIVFFSTPLVWARDKIVEYVEQGEKDAAKQTDPKQS